MLKNIVTYSALLGKKVSGLLLPVCLSNASASIMNDTNVVIEKLLFLENGTGF